MFEWKRYTCKKNYRSGVKIERLGLKEGFKCSWELDFLPWLQYQTTASKLITNTCIKETRLKWESMLRFKVLREDLKHETYPLVWLKDWGRSVWDLIAMLLSLASTQAADWMFVLRGSFKDWNLRMWVLLLLLFGQERKRAKERFCVSNLSHENENEWVITK
jgi:hypothetical protein